MHRSGFVGIFSFYPLHVVYIYYSWNQSSIHQMIPHRYVSHRCLFYSFFFCISLYHIANAGLVVEVGNKMKLTFQFGEFLWTIWHPSFASPFSQISIFNASTEKYHSVHYKSERSASNQHTICKNSPAIYDHSFFIKHTKMFKFLIS